MKFYIVDVFVEQKYQGNQLAVIVPHSKLSSAEMQQIAKEINFSETSFILTDKLSGKGYDVRIFTPDTEVPFAGHPVLGAAYIIHQTIESGKGQQVVLNLPIGKIPVSIKHDVYTMTQNQPSFGATVENARIPAEVLNICRDDIRTDYPIQVVSTGLPCVVVPLKSLEALKRCSINHEKFQCFIENVCKCNLLVFARTAMNDLRVRVFMDDTGFLEDAATGSANGNLAGYLLKYNYFNKSKVEYNVTQGTEINRPSLIRIRAELTDQRDAGPISVWVRRLVHPSARTASEMLYRHCDQVFKIQVGGKVHLVASGEWV